VLLRLIVQFLSRRASFTLDATDLEELEGGAAFQRSVLYVCLLGEVVGVLDRRQHALDGEERSQVGRVRRDDDEREKPPGAADDPPWQRPATSTTPRTSDAPHPAPVTQLHAGPIFWTRPDPKPIHKR